MKQTKTHSRYRRFLAAGLTFVLTLAGLTAFADTGALPSSEGGLAAYSATAYTATVSGIEKQKTAYTMLSLVNTARKTASAPALAWDAALEKVAVTRAREAAVYFSHTRPTGAQWNTLSTRLNAENLYVGYLASASTANSGWMSSSGHRTNRINTAYRSYAAACFQGRDGATYWVEVFSKTATTGTTPVNLDTDRPGIGVSMTDTYLSMKGTPTDLSRKTIATTDLRADYDYYFTLKNWNIQFDVSSTLLTKGVFTSSNSAIAVVDPLTGRIDTRKAGVVTITGKASAYSAEPVSTTLLIRPAKVKAVTAVSKTRAVTLTFAPAPGATGYEIYRADSATGTYTLAGTAGATATTWTCSSLTSGKTYYFKIRGFITKSGSTTRYTGFLSDPAAGKAL